VSRKKAPGDKSEQWRFVPEWNTIVLFIDGKPCDTRNGLPIIDGQPYDYDEYEMDAALTALRRDLEGFLVGKSCEVCGGTPVDRRYYDGATRALCREHSEAFDRQVRRQRRAPYRRLRGVLKRFPAGDISMTSELEATLREFWPSLMSKIRSSQLISLTWEPPILSFLFPGGGEEIARTVAHADTLAQPVSHEWKLDTKRAYGCIHYNYSEAATRPLIIDSSILPINRTSN
jgi:hypothetical protein